MHDAQGVNTQAAGNAGLPDPAAVASSTRSASAPSSEAEASNSGPYSATIECSSTAPEDDYHDEDDGEFDFGDGDVFVRDNGTAAGTTVAGSAHSAAGSGSGSVVVANTRPR